MAKENDIMMSLLYKQDFGNKKENLPDLNDCTKPKVTIKEFRTLRAFRQTVCLDGYSGKKYDY